MEEIEARKMGVLKYVNLYSSQQKPLQATYNQSNCESEFPTSKHILNASSRSYFLFLFLLIGWTSREFPILRHRHSNTPV